MIKLKQVCNSFFRIVLAVMVLIPYFLEPIAVNASSDLRTIKDMKNELARLKQEKSNNDKDKKLTQSQINSNKQTIMEANKEKEQIVVDIALAEEKIVESNVSIEKSKSEMESILKYYQMSDNQNAYIDYVMGAATITDLIMRFTAVNQITSYYNNKVTELDGLIKENEQLKVDLANKNVALDSAIEKSNNAIGNLNNHLDEISDVYEDLESRISNIQTLINMYAKICSSETQDVSTCLSYGSSNGWVKPMTKGRITQGFGANSSGYHYGIDISGVEEGTPLYASANGYVAAIIDGPNKFRQTGVKTCGGNIVYVNVLVNNKYYTLTYAHMLKYNVKVGQQVNITTQIGTLGGGPQTWWYDRCTTGRHLHYQISTGKYEDKSSLNARAIKPQGYPAKGVMWYNRSL